MKVEALVRIAVAVAAAGIAGGASAEPLLYTLTRNGSGSLNGVAFSNRAIVISLVADPQVDIASFGLAPTVQTFQLGNPDTFSLNGNLANFGVMGNPDTFSFTNQVYLGTTFSNVFYLAGKNTTPFVRDFLDVQLPDYADIYAPLEPVTGVAAASGLRQFVDIATSGGALTVTRTSSVTLRIDSYVAPVPEPATWSLMIVGLGAVGAAMRRRTKLRPLPRTSGR